MDPLLLVWAKRKKTETGFAFHPLRNHSLDTLAVMSKLWGLCLGAGEHSRFADYFGLSVDEMGVLLRFFAGAHDVGKLTPTFQSKDPGRYGRLAEANLPRDDQSARQDTPHGTQSAKILTCFLTDQGWCRDFAVEFASVIGGHHGSFISSDELGHDPVNIGTAPWREAQRQLLTEIISLLNVSKLAQPRNASSAALVLLAGVVSISDWIASNDELFPFEDRPSGSIPYFRERCELAEQALTSLGWLPRSRAVAFEGFEPLFQIEQPSSLQKLLLKHAQASERPKLFIVESPMGDGKTEAAFAAAEELRFRMNFRGLYCALPTQATSEQMFARLIHMLERRGSSEPQMIALLHGQASLSEEYARLRQQGREYMKLTSVGGEDEEPPVVAGDWFARPKRGLLTSYGVGTIDQILLSVLGSRHFFVRIFGLWGKVLIIDEVHAFDTYMTRILERLLTWAARIGTPVLLLSATLPRERRESLAAAYSKGLQRKLSQLQSCNYPRITMVDSQGGTAVPTVPRVTPRVVGLREVGRAELRDLLAERLKAGGNVAIVCNTVESARRLYVKIRSMIGGEVDLLHSRFLVKDRQERLSRVLNRVSRGMMRPYRSILISTQIIEQSLDLDFDLVVTELAPIDLILQRIGRLHRHERIAHPSFTFPEMWILQPDLKDKTPDFGASAWVYDEHILLRTWLLLQERGSIMLPAEIDSLIEIVYGDAEALRPEEGALGDFWQRTLQLMRDRIRKEEEEAERSHIRLPDADVFRLVKSIEDPERALARTRLFRPSVSLIVLYGQENGALSFDVNGTDVIDRGTRPSLADTKRLIESSANLPLRRNEVSPVFRLHKLHPTLPRPWRDRAVLSGMDVLLIDQSGVGEFGPLKLVLNPHLGLCRADTDYSADKE